MLKRLTLVAPAVLFLCSAVFTSAAVARDQLVVNTGFTPPVSTLFHMVLDEAGQRMGIDIVFQEMPAERSLSLVNSGIDDAECCRIPAVIQQEYPDLLSVPVSFYTARFVAFARDETIRIKSWNELRPYQVGVVAGWKILVNKVAEVQPEGYFVVDTPDAMFQMLDKGRIDVAVLGYLSGLQVIHKLNMQGVHVLEPPLALKPLYLQVHQRHRALVPKFAQVFEEMQGDGTIARLEEKVLELMQ